MIIDIDFVFSTAHNKARVTQRMDVGVIVGASLAAIVVIVLACGLVIWYITRKKYVSCFFVIGSISYRVRPRVEDWEQDI